MAIGGVAEGDENRENSTGLLGTSEVVGGEPALDGEWPDCAALLYGDDVGCTGVLIAPDFVLTAGHCLAFGTVTQVRLDTIHLIADPGEVINVVDQVMYPNWSTTYDVGLLFLQHSSSVNPRVLAHGCATEWIVDGAAVVVVGWGAIDQQGTLFPDELMKGHTAIGDADCDNITLGCNPAISPGGELAAGGNGVDACFGDSGGPLYLESLVERPVVGITSRSSANGSVPCGDGTIYGRPDAVVDWIELVIGYGLPEPNCSTVFVNGFESGDTTAWSGMAP